MSKRWGRIADLGERGLPDNWPTINRWVAKYGFPAPSRSTPGCTLFDLDAVDAWIEARRAKQPEAAA
jgi:hypothetical protein